MKLSDVLLATLQNVSSLVPDQHHSTDEDAEVALAIALSNTEASPAGPDQHPSNNEDDQLAIDIALSNSEASSAVPVRLRPVNEDDELNIAIALSKADIRDKPQQPERSSDARSETAPTDCSVCLEALGPREANALPCLHKFHRRCIMRWLVDEKKECPICRAEATAEDVVELY